MAFLKPGSTNASNNLADVKSEHVTNLRQGKLELELMDHKHNLNLV